MRSWYFATSNNALVHAPRRAADGLAADLRRTARRSTCAATDERNAEIWEGLGFDVDALGDFHPFAINLGAVHCIKKYLGPRPRPSRPGMIVTGKGSWHRTVRRR